MSARLDTPATVSPTSIGRHALADLCGLDPDLLRDADRVMDTLGSILDAAEFHVLRRVQHVFPGPHAGFTGVFLLSESHAAVHTYPEHGYLALDVFGCGPQDPADVARNLARRLGAQSVRLHSVRRGMPTGEA